jgi:hypothetical protein
MVILLTVAFCAIPWFIYNQAIAREAVKLYNLQPNLSPSLFFLGARACFWLGCNTKRWADAHFFFGKSF